MAQKPAEAEREGVYPAKPPHETITRIEQPSRHTTLLTAPDGRYLGVSENGAIGLFEYVDDSAIWQSQSGGYRHATTGAALAVVGRENGACQLRQEGKGDADVAQAALAADGTPAVNGSAALFMPNHGPADLPSESLRQFRTHGWVCLPAILSPETIDGLEQVACTGPYSDRQMDWRTPGLAQHPAVARTATEPVSLWLLRQYLQTEHIRLAHPPSMAVLGKDDGERDVQGWHSDFPYLWGITNRVAGGRVPVDPTASLSLSVQRNVCVSEFTRNGGATIFKLGSHVRNSGPPEHWGTGVDYSQKGYRKQHGLPYGGPEADVIEAPAGSIILYDSRTWHRAGVNRTETRRAAMLQAMVPMYVMPFSDTSGPYKTFLESDASRDLTALELREIEALMVHRIVGPGGSWAITVDQELTERTRRDGASAAGNY